MIVARGIKLRSFFLSGKRRWGICLLFLYWMTACQWEMTQYHKSCSLINGWPRGDTLSYHLPCLEQGELYQLDVDIRYTSEYPYRDLYLLVKHNMADSAHFVIDTLKCQLNDARGHPNGKGISSLYQLRIPYKKVRSDGSRCASFRITHCMSDEFLPGLTDIGVKVSLPE